jgi:hypothetical protein
VRATRRRRPLRRVVCLPPPEINLVRVADVARYVGSPEHKTAPSFAGPLKPRVDASRCDPKLADADELTGWLREGLRLGHVGAPFEGEFPRYVWVRRDGTVYEGRLVNMVPGHYKGYPLRPDEHVDGLP